MNTLQLARFPQRHIMCAFQARQAQEEAARQAQEEAASQAQEEAVKQFKQEKQAQENLENTHRRIEVRLRAFKIVCE
jgi:uncharacterized protein with von Willebrand factor type A (vWA) domain